MFKKSTRYHFVAESGAVFYGDPCNGDALAWEVFQEVDTPIPYQLSDENDPGIILRVLHHMPPEFEDLFPPAIAYVLCARYEVTEWTILWTVPIHLDAEHGAKPGELHFGSFRVEAEDMREFA